jgi:glycosyltransferase involved in cell wall biosynthesis
MLVAIVDPPHNTRGGDWYYRAYVPGKAMAEVENVHVVYLQNHHRARRSILNDADVVVLQAICDADLFPLIAERRRRGKLTVFEINDDFRAVQGSNPISKFYANPANSRLLLRLAYRCGAVQFSVPELEHLYGARAERRAIFPNQLWSMPEPRSASSTSKVVVGWGGSQGHLGDMRAVAPALREFLERREDVVFRIMGASAIAELFHGLPAGRVEHVPPGSIEQYHAFVESLDIGLAPLQNDGFNRSRSDVKFLEYACHGVVPVVQRLEPYLKSVDHGRNGFLVETPQELVDTLEVLVRDADMRHRVGQQAYASVADSRLQALHVQARLFFYGQVLDDLGHRPRTPAEVKALMDSFRRFEGAEAEERLVLLGPTAYEALVHDGLLVSQMAGKHAEASACFEEASLRQPLNAMPFLLRGATTQDEAALRKALQLEPRSLVAHLALGQMLASRTNPACLAEFVAAAELEPTYEAPYLAAAAFLRSVGSTKDADEFLAQGIRCIEQLGVG